MDANKFLPRSVVPHVESKTERGLTGGWGRGPGNNVSAVMCGVNAAQHQMAAHMDEKFGDFFAARQKARKLKRKGGYRKPVAGPSIVQASAPVETGVRLKSGATDVALRPWQEHALSRLKTKR